MPKVLMTKALAFIMAKPCELILVTTMPKIAI